MVQRGLGPILIYVSALAGVGLVLIKMGRWPQRGGGLPRCRKCEYLVVNISSERCPECGSDLAGNGTVRGVRHRRPAVWVSGVVVLLFALGWGGPQLYRAVNWRRLQPSSWLMKDLEG